MSPPPSSHRPAARPSADAPGAAPLLAVMLLAVAAVAALAFWDEERESRAALDEFADEQATLAASVASELSTRLMAVRRDALALAAGAEGAVRPPDTALDGYAGYTLRLADAPPRAASAPNLVFHVPVVGGRVLDLEVPPTQLLAHAARIERSGALRVLLAVPASPAFVAADGRPIALDPLRGALDRGEPFTWLGRQEAPALGLPARRAAAGIAAVDGGPFGRFHVAVVSSAERVRDREQRAAIRLALGVLVASGLVLAFGSAALRRQRRGLLLERELALSAVARQRDAELARAARAAIMGTFAMGIAHELGTPLGVITGRAEQLAERADGDPRTSRAVRAILDQAERIRRTIRGFLDVARGERPDLRDVAPGVVLAAAAALVEHRLGAAGVALVTDVPEGLPLVHGDVQMLQHALVNLLLNACEACASGGRVEVKIRTDGDRVAFTVVDDGAGITPEAAARATEPFFTTKGEGAGLGLAITAEIVKMHRGTLDLRAATPRGTTASIILPVAEAARRAA